VRWLDPSDTGTVIPRRPTLAVTGTDVRRTPTFRYRHSGVDASVDGYDARVSIWGGPAQGPKAAGFKAWEAAAYTDLHQRYPDKPSQAYTWAKRHTLRLFLLRMRQGGEKCLCNHSLYHYYELYWKPSPNKANAKHFVRKRPELFARGYKGDPPPQMCYTSRALVETVAQEARDYFDKGGYPYKVILSNAPRGLLWGENFFAVEPMDNSLFCRCPACQKWIALGKGHGNVPHYSQGIHSDYFFQFVNAVQKEFAKTHAGKGKRLVTLAYMTHAWPAKSAKLDPAVAVQFCFASSSAPYRRAEYENEIRLVRRWADEAKSSGRALYLWLYHGLYRYAADCGNYFCFPGFFAHAIADQMKLFKRLGYRGMLHCGLAPEIDTYVTFRLMDNADLDVDALLDDYFTGLYGAAAAPLKKLYLAIEAVYCDPSARPEKRGASGAETIWTRLGTRQRMAAFGQLMAEAHARAATQREKRNVKAFDLSIWQYMTAGRAQYDRRMIAPIPTVRAPAVPDAGGDPTQVAWDTAAPMGGDWFVRGGSTPAPRRFSGRLAHDAKYLYVELVDPCKSKALVVSPLVSCYDDWELFFAGQRGMPYRQFMVGPTGMVVALLNGEVNWRMYVRLHEHGIRVASDTSTGDKWVSRIAIPLEQVVPGGAKPGDTVYLNVVRVTSPQVGGGHPYSIATWVSHTTVHDVDRLAAITLEK